MSPERIAELRNKGRTLPQVGDCVRHVDGRYGVVAQVFDNDVAIAGDSVALVFGLPTWSRSLITVHARPGLDDYDEMLSEIERLQEAIRSVAYALGNPAAL